MHKKNHPDSLHLSIQEFDLSLSYPAAAVGDLIQAADAKPGWSLRREFGCVGPKKLGKRGAHRRARIE
ncbi:MAG TPA: hypothetical protein VLV83_23910 [Acidobacteriota bacterium]|nr:hypothetical protein [Acidobacteriota bacterium]